MISEAKRIYGEERRLEGKLEGRLEGKLESAKEIALKLFKKGASIEDVGELTELNKEQLMEIKNSLAHELEKKQRRKNFGAKPLCYPQPVFIISTYNEDGSPNAMNAAWGGISCDEEIMICMGGNHKTTENLKRCPDFVVSMATEDYLAACDYVGIETGLKVVNKLEKAGFTTTKAEFVNAPLINELPLSLECTMTSYDEETCHLFADIKNVSCDESVLTDGMPDPKKLKPIVFDPFNMKYLRCSEIVGNAFKDGLKFK